jgi:hypothetical protein
MPALLSRLSDRGLLPGLQAGELERNQRARTGERKRARLWCCLGAGTA